MKIQRAVPLPEHDEEEKFREVILYIASKFNSDQDFGKTRLFKVLLYAEWQHYIATEETITGHTYVRGPHGPIPSRGDVILAELEERRDLAIQQVSRGGYPQRRPIPLRDANLDLFTAQEIAIIDQVIEEQRGMTATMISQQSHRDILAWEVARNGEPIPFETSWLAPRPLTPEEIAYGLQLAAES
jgi:hypothetical protein